MDHSDSLYMEHEIETYDGDVMTMGGKPLSPEEMAAHERSIQQIII